jgi:hypothetical protein
VVYIRTSIRDCELLFLFKLTKTNLVIASSIQNSLVSLVVTVRPSKNHRFSPGAPQVWPFHMAPEGPTWSPSRLHHSGAALAAVGSTSLAQLSSGRS